MRKTGVAVAEDDAALSVLLNISPKAVQAWEQGSREPGDAALKLLTIAKNHPEVLLEA
jgi:DNA-binding transcriptional regulator YiaG